MENLQKISYKKLQETERFNSSLLENSPTPILVIRPDKSIEYVNPAFEKITGYTFTELWRKKPPYPWWTFGESGGSVKNLQKAFKKGTQKAERLFIRKNGKQFWVEVTSTTVKSDEKFIYFLSNWVDITKRKHAEQELRKKSEELELKTKSLKELNTALKVLVKSREEDKRDLEEDVIFNIKELIIPPLENLKKSKLIGTQGTYVEILESNLNDIVSSFPRRLSSRLFSFSPTEIKVASLIRHGKTAKEIADLLKLSIQTINSHRKNIRKKIGIKGKKVNLQTYLTSIQ